MDLAKICRSWDRDQDGVYRSVAKVSVSYPEEGNAICYAIEDGSFWFKHRNRVIQAMLYRFPFRGLFVDVGGGNGVVSLRLQESGLDVLLVEPGVDGARNAKTRGVRNVVNGVWSSVSVAQHCAGAIGLFDVVEHIQDDVAFLADIRETLVDDGRIYLTVPAFRLLWSADDQSAGHYRRYSMSSLALLLNKSGFEILGSTYFFQVLIAPIFLMRTLPSLLRLRKGDSVEAMGKEHMLKENCLTGVVLSMLEYEVKRIESGLPVKFGSSIFAVARKSKR